MIGLTISLARIVEVAGVLSIARTASADLGHTGGVGQQLEQGNTTSICRDIVMRSARGKIIDGSTQPVVGVGTGTGQMVLFGRADCAA